MQMFLLTAPLFASRAVALTIYDCSSAAMTLFNLKIATTHAAVPGATIPTSKYAAIQFLNEEAITMHAAIS